LRLGSTHRRSPSCENNQHKSFREEWPSQIRPVQLTCRSPIHRHIPVIDQLHLPDLDATKERSVTTLHITAEVEDERARMHWHSSAYDGRQYPASWDTCAQVWGGKRNAKTVRQRSAVGRRQFLFSLYPSPVDCRPNQFFHLVILFHTDTSGVALLPST
jgi:hypothetical protein